MNKRWVYLMLILTGSVLGAGGYYLVSDRSSKSLATPDKKEPLYWVAPMDPNYRRAVPGKSPMGMDLIPVYEENAQSTEQTPGGVRIAPEVVNNLGVRTEEVTVGDLSSEIRTVGYVQYNENQLIHIHPRVEGWVESLSVKSSGDPVVQGEPLYSLYSPSLVNAQEELVLALNSSNKRLEQAAVDRLHALHMPEVTIAALRKSRRPQQAVTFYAPRSGVVDNLNIRQGFFVKPGTMLMSIGSLDDIWVVGEIFERQASMVKVGDRVTMTLDYLPGRIWQGTVDYVYPALNSQTRTARVRMRFANRDHSLKPNMFAQLEIHSQAATAVLTIPREALIRAGNQDRVVLLIEDGFFKSIAVRTGRKTDDRVEVIGGLHPGDRVVTSAQFLIDSESSKTSDFTRMDHGQGLPAAVWVSAQILSTEPDQRLVNLNHEAIESWGWPEMTMDLAVADDVDLTVLYEGSHVSVEITRTAKGSYELTSIKQGTSSSGLEKRLQSAAVNGVINRIDAESRILNISREAIEKWGRKPATIDFVASKSIDISQLKSGDKIYFTFNIIDGHFIIVDVVPVEGGRS